MPKGPDNGAAVTAPALTSYWDGFAQYQRVLFGLNEKSVMIYKRHVAEFCSFLPDPSISNFTQGKVEEFLEACFTRGNSNVTRKGKLTALQAFSRYLLHERVLTENPILHVPRPRSRRKPMQAFIQADEYAMFRQCAPGTEKGLRDAVALMLFAFCGLRVSEVYGLNIEELLDDGKRITINIPETKHSAGRSVDLWAAPSLYVRQYCNIRLSAGASGRDPLLVSYNRGGRAKGHRLTAQALEQLIKTLSVRAGIRRAKITTHMLRAAHANDLQCIEGYEITAIMERMGWKDMATAGRYLIRRERIHRKYQSLHAYWSEFPRLWVDTSGGDAVAG